MPVCGKPITRTARDGRQIRPTFSYNCEIPLEEDERGTKAHEGPCASPSDLHSVQEREIWKRQHDRDEELARHQASGLGMTQSLPLPSAAIVEPGDPSITDPQRRVGRPHPSQAVECPFCSATPMYKDFQDHVRSHDSRTPGAPVKENPTPVVARDPSRDQIRSEVHATLPHPDMASLYRPPWAVQVSEPIAGEATRVVGIEDPSHPANEPTEGPMANRAAHPEESTAVPRSEWLAHPAESYGMNISLARAILDAYFADNLIPDVVASAWDHIKSQLR